MMVPGFFIGAPAARDLAPLSLRECVKPLRVIFVASHTWKWIE